MLGPSASLAIAIIAMAMVHGLRDAVEFDPLTNYLAIADHRFCGQHASPLLGE